MRDPSVAKMPTLIDRHVGSQVRRRRRDLEMTQEELGNVLGLSFQQIQKYENGVNRVSAGRLYEFAAALQVNVAYFYQGLNIKLTRLKLEDHPFRGAPDSSVFPVLDKTAIELGSAFDKIPDVKLKKTIVLLVKQMKAALAAKATADGE